MRKSNRLSIFIASAIFMLLALSLGVMFYYSHTALSEEAMRDAEQTLEGTTQNIDNILLSVEQSAGNVYNDMLIHLDKPERMFTYSRELVKCNPHIVGCAIAFKPGYYPGRELFMAYVHYKTPDAGSKQNLVTSEGFADRPYTEQKWFTKSLESGWIGWMPLKGEAAEREPLVSFCLPIYDSHGERVGVMAVEVSIQQLSKIVLAAKPSANGYSVLLARNGSYIVHPDPNKLYSLTAFAQDEPDTDIRLLEAIEEMQAGKAGNRTYRMDGREWRLFYKPFQRTKVEGRSEGALDWSVGVVYPEDDIHSEHNRMLFLVLAIAVIGMCLFCVLCRFAIRRHTGSPRKLAMTLALMAAPIFIISLGILYYQSRSYIHQESLESAESQLNTALQRVVNYMNTISTAADANAWRFEEHFNRESIDSVSNILVQLNRNVVSSSVFIVPDKSSGFPNQMSFYTENQGDTVVTYCEPEYDYSSKMCYVRPLKTGESCWVDPFIEYTEGRVDHHQAIATYCRPLRQADGRIVGVLTTDMSFSRLAKLINDASLDDDHGFFYILLGADGRFLIHPDASRQYRKTIFSDLDPRRNADIITLGHEIATGKRGTLHVKYNGQRYHVCYKPVPGTDWSLALVCPEP